MTNTSGLLSDPLVLRAAWKRVRTWYRGTEWHDPFELADFELNLPERLTQIGNELQDGSYELAPFPLIPYPKKGTHLRHYCAPSVRDQVAFTVFGVLLGPLIDRRLQPFVFGNRIYRSLGQDRSNVGAWKRRPYELDARQLYMPYRRDYALFRRVAHWSAAAMVGAAGRAVDAQGEDITPDQFEPAAIPDCCKPHWWKTQQDAEGYWARLDLKMAFPCITKLLLNEGFDHALRDPEAFGPADWLSEPADDTLDGYPGKIKRALLQYDVARSLRESFLRLFDQIGFSSNAIATDHWNPDDSQGLILPGHGEHVGLPTGLAISGLLLNLALAPIDERIADLQEKARSNRDPWAFLRFADDMIVLAPTAESLKRALQVVRRQMEESDGQPSNLRINQEKASPDPIRDWLGQKSAEISEIDLKPHVLRRDHLGSFVTRLVENMSRASSTESIARFGDTATQRLQELADLALLNIDDGEVRADTRLSYAANRLSSAYLPDESDVAQSRRHLATVREGIATAIDKAPWKFSLWRAAIRAACRRIPGEQMPSDEGSAREWLGSLLRRIRSGPTTKSTLEFGAPKRPTWQVAKLELSFVRTIVWRELSATLRDLLVAQRLCIEGRWSSQHWTFRAVDENQIAGVVEFLADFDRWSDALYWPTGRPKEDWRWEWQAILAAAHAHPSWDPFRVWNQRSLKDAFGPRTGRFRRLLSHVPTAIWQTIRGYGPLVRIRLSAQAHNEKRIADALRAIAEVDDDNALWQAGVLGCEHLIDKSIASRANKSRSVSLWDLSVRRIARRRLMMSLNGPGPVAFVHALLWAVPQANGWRISPRLAPAIPFSAQFASRMLCDILVELWDTTQNLDKPFSWKIESELLETTRRHAFGSEPLSPPLSHPATGPRLVALGSPKAWRSVGWHPAVDIPLMLGHEKKSLARHIWCHLLQFMIAVTGSEYWLDLLLDYWPARLPLDEHWTLRSQVHLPSDVWKAIDKIFKDVLNGNALLKESVAELLKCLQSYSDGIDARSALVERVDVELKLDPDSILDLPCTSGALDGRPKLRAPRGGLSDNLRVRLGQVSSANDWNALRDRFANTGMIRLTRTERQRVMRQVSQIFRDGDLDGSGEAQGPLILPEVAIPWEELPAVQRLSQFHERAVLMGMLWRERAPFLPSRRQRSTRYLLNEAVLLVPLRHGKQRIVRGFTIQKPLPAHAEEALVRSVSNSKVTWQLLPGRKWYRFVHPKWGDFTVAICSDLIDPTPWNSLQGLVAHLFMISCNQDIETFDALTWIRAFELHANVVAVNQGEFGGSFVWTPEAGHKKEIARLRGPRLSLIADVSLKVKRLMDHQKNGVSLAVDKAQDDWEGMKQKRDEFKAPPPGFRGRT